MGEQGADLDAILPLMHYDQVEFSYNFIKTNGGELQLP
jgi:hypothetical protein